MAEKVRALAGQHRYAIARDLYDIAQLLQHTTVDRDLLSRALSAKMRAKDLPPRIDLGHVESRREEFKDDWERNLMHLLPPDVVLDFELVWAEVLEFLAGVARRLA